VEPDRICQIVDTVIDLSAPSKTALLQDLARRAAPVVNVDANFLFNALLQREELGSTGVGNGVALPHVRLEQVKNPFAIMVRLKHPIDFEKTRMRSSTRSLASPEDFESRNSSRNCAARPIVSYSIIS
jgi:mannitol/fructose-specific phosphotransferase system IIA component (Ntr-type)